MRKEKTFTTQVGSVGVPRNWVLQKKVHITVRKIVCTNSGEERIICDSDLLSDELCRQIMEAE